MIRRRFVTSIISSLLWCVSLVFPIYIFVNLSIFGMDFLLLIVYFCIQCILMLMFSCGWLPCAGFKSKDFDIQYTDITAKMGENSEVEQLVTEDENNLYYHPSDFNPTQTLQELILGQGIVGEQAILWSKMHHTPNSNISKDEMACIFLYTVESPFYKELNRAMRTKDYEKYLDYIFYLSTTLTKLPSFAGSVYRGIDCKMQYPIGKVITWSGFSSATRNPQSALSFLKSEEGTLFLINAKTAKIVSEFAPEAEDEVLFLPNTKFRILSEISQAERDILSTYLNVQLRGCLTIYNLVEL